MNIKFLLPLFFKTRRTVARDPLGFAATAYVKPKGKLSTTAKKNWLLLQPNEKEPLARASAAAAAARHRVVQAASTLVREKLSILFEKKGTYKTKCFFHLLCCIYNLVASTSLQ